MAKLCYIDVETTGLDPKLNGIIQLSGIIVIDGQECEQFDYKVQPLAKDVVSQKALEVNKKTVLEIGNFTPATKVKAEFELLLSRWVDKYKPKDKFWFVGYNATFDQQFVREWFVKLGSVYFGSWFWTPIIDVMTIAGSKMIEVRPQMDNFKLGTVCKQLGITEAGELHDAMTDIRLTRKVLQRFVEGV